MGLAEPAVTIGLRKLLLAGLVEDLVAVLVQEDEKLRPLDEPLHLSLFG
jgi:hypothetical protein